MTTSTMIRPMRSAWRSFLFLSSALVTGTIGFVVLLVGWLATALLAVTPLVVPAAVAFRWAIGACAAAEALLARELLGEEVAPQPRSSGGSGYWGRGAAVASDGRGWRQQAYVAVRTVVGWPFAVGVVSLVGSGLFLIALPVTYRWVDTDVGSFHVDTLQRALLAMTAGLVVLGASLLLVRLVTRAWERYALPLLGPAGGGRRGLATLRRHAVAVVLVDVVVLVVWASVGGVFWPAWVISATALPLALRAWAEYAYARRRSPLVLLVGLFAVLELFLVVCWAIAGAGTFWPIWPAIGFATLLVLIAVVLWQRGTLVRRIRVLETSRAGAVDVQESDLRRIERDLHDGAQARLVALGMSLGMAEQKLDADPAAARELVLEARVGVEAALRELRDLARGVHPPVLTDRGLEAAIASLAQASAVPVELDADVPERPPAVVETAAYFVAAEAMANAAKHAGASRILVTVRRAQERLVVEVTDDGLGGADAFGSGLTGLRRRVEALDGTLMVVSPSGGGTTLRAELPCVS